MHRQRLRDALLEPVEDFVRFGARVTDVQQGDSDADPVTVVLDNGETVRLLPSPPVVLLWGGCTAVCTLLWVRAGSRLWRV